MLYYKIFKEQDGKYREFMFDTDTGTYRFMGYAKDWQVKNKLLAQDIIDGI